MEIVLIIGGVLIAAAIVAVFTVTGFIAAAYFGAPFVPTGRDNVMRMLALADVRPGERMADIGSGDGRILIAFARAGVEAHGFEINPMLVWWSRWCIARAGLAGKAFVHQGDYRNEDFSRYTVVTVFGISCIMRALGEKLARELPPGGRVVSNAFSIPGWRPAGSRGDIKLYGVPEAVGYDEGPSARPHCDDALGFPSS